MDYGKIKETAQGYLPAMTRFLRELIRSPGESCQEEGHIRRIAKEMEDVGFDRVVIDGQGNVLGYMGQGSRIIAFDAHIDTVGIGARSNWNFDPYEGFETDTQIGGRGASDQLGGIVSSVYGARIMKDLGLIPEDVTILVTGTVQEDNQRVLVGFGALWSEFAVGQSVSTVNEDAAFKLLLRHCAESDCSCDNQEKHFLHSCRVVL